MSLPIHRWFRYSAGFSAQWVERVLDDWQIDSRHIVLDPFAGSGTVSVVCDTRGIRSIGIEAHPVVARACKAKLSWATLIERFSAFAEQTVKSAKLSPAALSQYPSLIQRSFDPDSLAVLDSLKTAWFSLNDESHESELVWLAITAVLRACSKAGTAQWQYILPNKSKANVAFPDIAFRRQIEMMKLDMRWMQNRVKESLGEVISTDARHCSDSITHKVDAVITSPPYANNYDYADALRFEMTFWGEVNGWGDIHDKVRKYLMVSSSQHSSHDKLDAESLLSLSMVEPIRKELTSVVHELSRVREMHGGKKNYHTMVAAYCRDISLVLHQLRRVCRKGAKMCWVIGDSAPYGVYCPIEKWIGELALAAGFDSYTFKKLRDRNIKWKNRKHRVPLKEGLLWIEG
ncbi:MAG: DNA modification methylase [Nitrospirae bacterium]|nr:DNA modification methylase [Nitrospirota bacterium]